MTEPTTQELIEWAEGHSLTMSMMVSSEDGPCFFRAAAERLRAMQWQEVTDDGPAFNEAKLCRWIDDDCPPVVLKRTRPAGWVSAEDDEVFYEPPSHYMHLPPPPEGGR